MKTTIIILIISLLTGISYAISSSHSVAERITEQTDNRVLDFYCHFSSFTDPGEYAYLYKDLPESLAELCRLIKSQIIHPFGELEKYRDLIPKERWNEYLGYPTVKSILEGLLKYDSRGFVKDRKPENRLVLGCQHNAILLASILKYRGIPARVRSGHASYLIPNFNVSHTICEVWNEKENRWMLVDPSMDKVDFSREEFDISNELWIKYQNNEIDPNQYGLPGRYTGLISILGKITADLASILGTEYPVTQYAPILDYVMEGNQLSPEQISTLDNICNLMKTLDANNLFNLRRIYNSTPEIQTTKSFTDIGKDSKTSVNKPAADKPDVEFVDIPGGTFIMGSPESEAGRENDEVQHEVTLSSFKISKYTITVKQYNLFCKATGRNAWYGPFGQDELSVTQVTWDDAQAFAEWMGCRLPTEAEFEYAMRAGTTTPFYTGNCLTTDQANYNGEEPYENCEKGINRNKPIPAGSFAPNAFGLYDMHGNMLEWCSDWYGEYNIDDKVNPKGPKTGSRKVLRGGGWFDPVVKSRSAYRGGGVFPATKGAGISFRIVKSN